MATTAAEVEMLSEKVSEKVENEEPKAEVFSFRDEKMKRIRDAAARNGIAANFNGVVFACTRGNDRMKQRENERARLAAASESRARASSKCACGNDAYWRCDMRVDDGPLFKGDPEDGKRKTRVCGAATCAACVFRVGRDGYCPGCKAAAIEKTKAEAVDLDELEAERKPTVFELAAGDGANNEPPVGTPDGDDEGTHDDGVEVDLARVTVGMDRSGNNSDGVVRPVLTEPAEPLPMEDF